MKVSTFANSDTYGSNGISQFQTSASALGIEIITSYLFPVGQTSFAKPIADALQSGSRIFIFFMAAVDMGTLISQGYNAGLFKVGTQIVASDAGANSIVWALMPKLQVTEMMKGVIAFVPSPDYTTHHGARFLRNFINQTNTIADPMTRICNNQSDDSGGKSPYLFKTALNPLAPTVYTCSGVNFTKFKKDGSNLDSYAAYSYDATYAVARAMHVVLYDQKYPKVTGKALYYALINNVSFVGATGSVNFSHALTSDSTRFGEGDRRTGVYYKIVNFKSEKYYADPSGMSGYSTVGSWTVETRNRFVNEIIYNTADNLPPTYWPPAIYLHMSSGYINFLISAGAVLITICGILTASLIVFRSTKLMKSIQLKMQFFIMIGAFLGGVRIITGQFEISDETCAMHVWLGHLSFWFIFSPIMLKTWRVHRIVNNKTLKRLVVTENYIISIFFCMILTVITYLTIIQNLDCARAIMITAMTNVGPQSYSEAQCGAEFYSKSCNFY